MSKAAPLSNHGSLSWVLDLDRRAQAKLTIALARLQRGNTSNVEAVGEGVCELKLNWGPGYRVYFGQDGRTIVILLCGGTKKRQSHDIQMAKVRWADYRARKSARAR
jgi:putative addiction module killer protein